jgi:hypothetical protein
MLSCARIVAAVAYILVAIAPAAAAETYKCAHTDLYASMLCTVAQLCVVFAFSAAACFRLNATAASSF